MERTPFHGVRLFFLAYFALLVLALTFIGVLGLLGYELIHASLKYLVFGLLAGSAMIAGIWWLLRRVHKTWQKLALGLPLGTMVLALLAIMYMGFTMILYAQTPVNYAMLASPGGKMVAVMYRLDTAEALRAASGGDMSQLKRYFAAHPVKMNFFYYIDGAAEGEIVMAADSDAELAHEWMDETTLRLYVENPAEEEGGELILRLN